MEVVDAEVQEVDVEEVVVLVEAMARHLHTWEVEDAEVDTAHHLLLRAEVATVVATVVVEVVAVATTLTDRKGLEGFDNDIMRY